jgi:hypothetical protein
MVSAFAISGNSISIWLDFWKFNSLNFDQNAYNLLELNGRDRPNPYLASSSRKRQLYGT